jgi:hypothetical protein
MSDSEPVMVPKPDSRDYTIVREDGVSLFIPRELIPKHLRIMIDGFDPFSKENQEHMFTEGTD